MPSNCAEQSVQVNTQQVSVAFKLSDILTDNVKLKLFTGLPSLESLDIIVFYADKLIDQSNQHDMPLRERVIIIMCRLKMDITFKCLAVLFNVCPSTITRIFRDTVHAIGKILQNFITWPSKEEILLDMPKCFKKYTTVRVVLDCTEVPVEKSKCLNCRMLCYSNYKSTHTV